MRAEKQYLIDEVNGHLKKSEYVILANFTKMTVADTAELRKRLAVEKAEFHVVKNSSFRVAATALGLPDLEKSLSGQTAIVVGPAAIGSTLNVAPSFLMRSCSRRMSPTANAVRGMPASNSCFW